MTPVAAITLPPIAGYHPTTMIDWHGRLAAVVFLPQCNLRCRFCHAGALLEAPAASIPVEEVLEDIAARQGWIDSIVICGGEPTLWPTLPALCETFRQAGLSIKLDTNGTHPDRLEELLRAGLIDAVAMDLKAPLDERYHAACGPDTDVAAIRRSVQILMAGVKDYEFRTTVCPTLIGPPEMHAMGSQIAGAHRWVLQRFEPAYALDPALRGVKPYDPATMEALAEIGRQYVARCQIRGQPEICLPPAAQAFLGKNAHH
jgi:pyruvate formate lyase activating enzyme